MNKSRKKPLLIYADTVKGKGFLLWKMKISGIQNYEKEDFENAISELDNQI